MALTTDAVKKIRMATIAGIIIGIIVILAIKKNNPSFDIFKTIMYTVIAGAGLTTLGVAIYWFSKKNGIGATDQGKLPPPITFAQARDLALQALADPAYTDEFDTDRRDMERVLEVGKSNSNVYLIVAYGKHSPDDKYAVGINMHYPHLKRGFLVNPKNSYEITKMVQDLGVDHEEELPKRIRRVRNLSTGTEVEEEEAIPNPEGKTEKKEDPLDK